MGAMDGASGERVAGDLERLRTGVAAELIRPVLQEDG
jgi:hypothetical protein